MKKISLICLLIFAISSFIFVTAAQSQPRGQRGGGYGMGPGMMWGYGGPGWGMGPGMMGGYGGYGYGMGHGMMGGWVIIPPKLPTPKNAEWVQKLKDIFASEKESLAQYETDQEKYNAYMPYMMVIPQEENHIYWIEQMFAAYEIKIDVKTPQIIKSKSLEDAYEIGVKLESDLLPRYEWLIKNAEDRDTRQALNTILLQSRMHLVMFDHSMRIGHGYGYGMRYGGMGWGYGMGPGMMHGYGGYGRQPYRSGEKAIDMKEAKAMLNDYLRATRNPNLKLGKIKDTGSTFEAEVLTKNNSLVDKIVIDKYTGWIRSAY